jgi:hypothetical protein
MFLQNIKEQPTKLILEYISRLKYKDIQKLCRNNTRINKICKANKNTIAKYVLQNDYLFTKFPNNINYTNIMKYIQNIHNIFPFPSTNLKKITEWKTNILAVSNGHLQVVKFLVKNGVNNLNRSFLDSVKKDEPTIRQSSNVQIKNILKSKISGGNVKNPIKVKKQSKTVNIKKPSKTVNIKKSSKTVNIKNINYKVLSNKKKDCIKKKVGIVMNELKKKKLHSSNGKLVTNPKQGIAIALSIAKRNCL